jgi:hypothetical protein
MDWAALIPIVMELLKKWGVGGDDPASNAQALVEVLKSLAQSFNVVIQIKSK